MKYTFKTQIFLQTTEEISETDFYTIVRLT